MIENKDKEIIEKQVRAKMTKWLERKKRPLGINQNMRALIQRNYLGKI